MVGKSTILYLKPKVVVVILPTYNRYNGKTIGLKVMAKKLLKLLLSKVGTWKSLIQRFYLNDCQNKVRILLFRPYLVSTSSYYCIVVLPEGTHSHRNGVERVPRLLFPQKTLYLPNTKDIAPFVLSIL